MFHARGMFPVVTLHFRFQESFMGMVGRNGNQKETKKTPVESRILLFQHNALSNTSLQLEYN